MAEKVKKANLFIRIGKFFKEVKGEMKKVIWPTWKQTVNNTSIVIAVILLVGLFLAVIDIIFGGVIRGVVIGDFAKSFTDAVSFM